MQLHRDREQFGASGARLVVIGQGTPAQGAAFLASQKVELPLYVDKDRESASMVSAMISLAENLGMTPLAEGIETEGEWRFLASRNCTYGQGYFFSRPVPAPEILAMHRRSGLQVLDGGAG